MDDEWAPSAGATSASMDSSEPEIITNRSTRRRSSNGKKSKKKRKTLTDNDSSSDGQQSKVRQRRSSLRSNESKKPQAMINLASSDSSDASQNENNPSLINTAAKPKKSKRNSKSKSEQMDIDTNNDADNECDSPLKPPKKRNRKRKSETTDNDGPPNKKRRSSNSNSNNKKQSKKDSKAVKLKGSAAVERIREYMVRVNRPHSKNSLRMQIGEKLITANECEKSLNALRHDGIVVMREFGKKQKTKIYWPEQTQYGSDNDSDTKECESRASEMERLIKERKAHLSRLKQETSALRSEKSDQDLESEGKQKTAYWNKLRREWAVIEESTQESVSAEVIEESKLMFFKYGKSWKERKNVMYDMMSQVFMESNDKPDKILSKQLNGETDKESGVSWDDGYKEMFADCATVVQQKKDKEANERRNKK